jgi:hypothetical protein
LARRCRESIDATEQSTSIEKDDERVLVVDQIVDLTEDILDVPAKCVPKSHSSECPLRDLCARRRGHGGLLPLHGPLATFA